MEISVPSTNQSKQNRCFLYNVNFICLPVNVYKGTHLILASCFLLSTSHLSPVSHIHSCSSLYTVWGQNIPYTCIQFRGMACQPITLPLQQTAAPFRALARSVYLDAPYGNIVLDTHNAPHAPILSDRRYFSHLEHQSGMVFLRTIEKGAETD